MHVRAGEVALRSFFSSLNDYGRERDAFWRGFVAHYGGW
jgi:hypothetical protein